MTANDKRWLTAILILAFAARLAVAVLLPDQGFDDARGYRMAGAQLWHGQTMSSTYIMPLYPLLVGLAGGQWGQWLLDAALSTASVWLIHRLAFELFGDRIVALFAAIGMAIYPYAVFYAAVGLTEPLFVTLILASFLAWYRGAFTVAAIFTVLAILTRPSIEPLAPLLVVYFGLAVHRLSLRTTLRHLGVYALVYVALMLPWWAHNYAKYGQFVRLNLASGFLLYAGNNPMNQTGGGILFVDWNNIHMNVSDPVAQDRAYRDDAIAYIKQHPGRSLELVWVKFVRFWRLWPYTPQFTAPSYIFMSLASFLPILLGSLAYLLIWGRAHFVRILPILAFAGCLTAIHTLLVSSIRYRYPIEPFMIVFASFAFARLLERLRILPAATNQTRCET